jgi:hypothetical protein
MPTTTPSSRCAPREQVTGDLPADTLVVTAADIFG